jgi:membrane protein DedA with SNARE-associated domain
LSQSAPQKRCAQVSMDIFVYFEYLTAIIIHIIDEAGYPGIFLLMALEGSFLPIPSEIILPFSGFLVSEGRFSLWLVALIGALGNIVGTLVTYTLARHRGLPFLLKYGKYVLVTHHDIENAQRLFAKYGARIIFITRLLPGIRGFLPIPAGIARMKVAPFVFYVFIGSFLWSFFLTYIGFLVRENWEIFGKYAHELGTGLVLLLLILVGWWLKRQYTYLRKEKKQEIVREKQL